MAKMAKQVRHPNDLLYRLAIAASSFLLRKKYALSIRKSAGAAALRPPYVVIANHISNIDFTVVANAAWPTRLNFVVAAFYFRVRFLGGLLRFMGCFSKEQFQPDAQAVKNIFSVIRRGDVVAVYPSGQSTLSGEGTHIDASIAPLLKRLAVPVVAVHVDGAFIACPKWHLGLRKSRMEASVDVLFTPQDLEQLSIQEIYQKTKDALYFDDYEWQRRALVKASRPHSAKGLERVLFCCPRCNGEFTMRAKRNKIYCASCGNAALMNEYGLLQPHDASSVIFDTPTAWSRWQMQRYRQELGAPAFRYSEPAHLVKIGKHGRYKKVGQGRAEISVERFCYCGTYGKKTVEWEVRNSLSAVFAHEVPGHFDFAHNGELYSIAPFNGAAALKFVALKEAIFDAYL